MGEPLLTKAPTVSSTRFEWLARVSSGVVMALVALAGVASGGLYFAIIIGIGAVAALREWHRLINGGSPRHGVTVETIVSSLTVITGVLLIYSQHSSVLPVLIILLGGMLAGASAAFRKTPILLNALGSLYIGGPALVLVALLWDHAHGGWLVLGLLIAVWAADTGALFFGRLIGGPKLAPALSPGKTWAGFWGGVIFAALAEAIYVLVLGGAVTNALIFGALLAIAGHAGDLFESWVKRSFRAKNTGTMIPGHGGMLDRIDSLLFAAPIAAGLVFLLQFDPLAGVQW